MNISVDSGLKKKIQIENRKNRRGIYYLWLFEKISFALVIAYAILFPIYCIVTGNLVSTCIMNRDQILRRNDEITAETDAVIRRGKEIVSKLESGAIKPDDPQVKEVLQQLIERRRIGNEFNAELTRLVHEQSDEPTRTPR